jgi:hypothetical protein
MKSVSLNKARVYEDRKDKGQGKHEHIFTNEARRLETLPMHDGGTGFVVLALGDPHLLEGRQRGQDGLASRMK